MKATVEYRANPFAPSEARVVTLRSRARLSRLAPRGRAPVIALVNGVPVLRTNRGWQRRRLADGDRVVFATLPRGGGGGGGSNPLRLFLQIALIAVAGPLALGGTLAGAFGITLGQAQAGILLVGSALINAALPVPQPGQGPQASPTYSLQAQGNAARVGAPIPVQYGRVLAYPDFAATPYAEYAGEDQYLYQLLCLGAGEYEVEEVRIEDTPISSFTEIETQVVGPGGQVTLFPTQVVTSVEVAGQEMPGRLAATWSRSGTTITVTSVAHGLASGQAVNLAFTTGGGPSGTYAIATVPGADTFTVTTAATGTAGDCTVDTLVGGLNGFVASAAGQVAHRLGIDLAFPFGLYNPDASGDLNAVAVPVVIEAQRIDDSGAALGGWAAILTETVEAKTATPVRRSFVVTLGTPGRYRVRARRISAAGQYDQVIWAGLRAYLAEEQDFGPVTLIALRMRATNNLSLQASRRVAVIATRKLPVWNGTSWSAPVATRSIAWAIADAARNADYGAGRADAKVDLAALLALDAVWAARGDTFSFRFDQGGTWWDAVQRIAAAGRARAYMQGGILRIARDAPQTVPVALYSMRNIVKGSFRIDYVLPQADASPALDVHYFDSATWAPQRERIVLFGAGSGQPARLALDGVDNRPQAVREGRYHAAAARYRRRVVFFETEMEGFIPSVLDLIAIQHDMPGWGAQAEVRGWDAATRTLTLTEPVEAGAQTVVALRRPDGTPWGPVAVVQGATPHQLVLASLPDFTPATAQDRERTHAAIGTSQTWAMTARFLSARPRGQGRVAIEAVAEDPAVHAAELGVALPPRRASDLPRRFTQPVVAGLFARPVPGDATLATIGWRPAPGADTYHVELAEGLDPLDPQAAWTRIADTSAATAMVVLLHARRTMIRVRGMGLAAGPWTAATVGSLITEFWNPAPSTSMWTTDGTPMWSS